MMCQPMRRASAPVRKRREGLAASWSSATFSATYRWTLWLMIQARRLRQAGESLSAAALFSVVSTAGSTGAESVVGPDADVSAWPRPELSGAGVSSPGTGGVDRWGGECGREATRLVRFFW